MCTVLCPNTLKLIFNVSKRNLHSLIQGHNSKIWFSRTFDKVPEFISRRTNSNLLYLNKHIRCHSSGTNIQTNMENEGENNQEDNKSEDLYSNVDYNAITEGDTNLLKKLKILILEVEVMIQEGVNVPSNLKTSQWKELLLLETRSARRRLLNYLFINEMKRNNESLKKANKQLKVEERRAEQATENDNNSHIKYGFQGSTIFLRVYPSKIDNFFNSRLINAIKFGQNLVVDCSYDNYMTPMELKNCAKQIMLMFADNRLHDEPFNLHFCSAEPESRLIRQLHKLIPTMFEPSFPMNITEKSYLDVFQKDKLVYLTPHCHNQLTTFNNDDIYIIGKYSKPFSIGYRCFFVIR